MKSIRDNISFYKLQRLAYLALKNAIRLHFDSILLFKHRAYPSAKQLSILAMEELGKAQELEHYYFHSKYDSGPMPPVEEQKYLKLYYDHSWKQGSAIMRDMVDYSPRYIELVRNAKLELAKQNATYVGLKRRKGSADVNSKIQSPFSIKDKNARQQISLINDILLEMCKYNIGQNGYFSIDTMDTLIETRLRSRLKKQWKYRSQLKSTRWYRIWTKKFTEHSFPQPGQSG